MRVFLVFLLLLASPAYSADREKFEAYRAGRADRRATALSIRRQLNAGKVHVYRTAVVVPVGYGVPAIQGGMIQLPRPVIVSSNSADLLTYFILLNQAYGY
jgi:hypothetical protein